MALVQRDASAVQGVRDLRKALRSETRPEAAVARIEQTVPELMGGLRRRLEQSSADVADELSRQAGSEIREVERRAEALARAERRLSDKVRALTEKDPSVRRKVERMHRHLGELDVTARELMEGMVELEKGFAPLDDTEKERLMERASAALFRAFDQPGPLRITTHDDGRKRSRRDPASEAGESHKKRQHRQADV